MFKWIFLAQAVVYLLLMPATRAPLEPGYLPSIHVSVLAILGLIGGYLLLRLQTNRQVPVSVPAVSDALQPRPILTLGVPVLAVLYAVVVVAFGLLNRRQGSEFMAELYADLPIFALAIVRGYEILFVPLALAYAFSDLSGRTATRVFVGLVLLASLPFMGITDSRGRLVVLAIYMLCFVKPASLLRFLYQNVRFYIAAAMVVGAFVFYSLRRSESYASVNDYLLAEVYQRLDGLNLATDLRDAGVIDWFGQWDWQMFTPLLSKIPFLEAAQAAKAMGRTSTKQYYLQDLLGRNQLDAANSMITDPLYFAGWLGVAVAFCALGYFIARVDRLVARGQLFVNRSKTALAIAFVTSFALIENDFMAAPTTFIQNYILTGLLLYFGFARASELQPRRDALGPLTPVRAAP